MASDPHAGWTFEGPDPEVGIFGDMVAHDPCVDAEGNPAHVSTDVKVTASDTPGIVDVTEIFTCYGCGAMIEVRTQQPADEFEYTHEEGQ